MSEQTKNLNQRVYNLEKAVHKLESIYAPWKQDKAGIGPQAASNTEAERAPGKIPSVPPAPANSEKPKDSTTPRFPRRSITRKVWRQVKRIFLKKDRLERVGIIFGVAYAVTTILQWRDLRHNFEADQRAWIKITYKFPNNPRAAGLELVTLRQANVGKSPVPKLTINHIVEIVDAQAHPSFVIDPKKQGWSVSTLVFPQDHDDNIPAALVDSNSRPRSITDQEVNSLIGGQSYIAVFGLAIYADQFGAHWTRFCGWKGYGPEGINYFKSPPCTLWNAVGDGEPPK